MENEDWATGPPGLRAAGQPGLRAVAGRGPQAAGPQACFWQNPFSLVLHCSMSANVIDLRQKICFISEENLVVFYLVFH